MLLRQTTVWLAFQQIVFRTPDVVALVADHQVTWRELHAQVLGIVQALVHLGLGPGDGVVVSAKSAIPLYVLHLATLAVGGVVAHVRATWRAEELAADILVNAKAKILVLDTLSDNFVRAIRDTSSPTAHELHAVVLLRGISTERALALNLPVSLLSLEELQAVAQQCASAELPLLLDRSVMPTDACAIAFDYDAQGRVRGTAVSHDNVMFTAATLARSLGPLSWQDRMVAYLPLHHLASQVLELFLPLLCGITVHCMASVKGESLMHVVKRCRPTVFFATPDTWASIGSQVYRAKRDVNTLLYAWAKTRATNNAKKRRFGHGASRSLGYLLAKRLVLRALQKQVGLESCLACYSVLAPLDFELEKLFTTIDVPIYQLYGVPECTGFAAINFAHNWEFGTCGRALRGTAMEYDHGSQELLLRGRHVFLGYVKTHGQLVPHSNGDGWLRVPQQGHLTPDGFLKLTDAPRQFVVLATGEWVPIAPFENALIAQQPELERAVLVGDGRAFLSVLLFLKTAASSAGTATSIASAGDATGTSSIISRGSRGVSFSGASGHTPNGAKPGAPHRTTGVATLSDDVIQLSQRLGSNATTIRDVLRCQRWAVHFDKVLDELPRRVGVSGVQVRKWIVMAEPLTVDGGELDPDSGEVQRHAVDRKFQALLDSLYC